MELTRRQLLKISLIGTTGVALIGGGLVWSWWDTPPDTPYKILNNHEVTMVLALSQASFPTGNEIPLAGKDAGIDYFFDQLLFGLGNENQKLLKLLLQALNRLPLLSKGQYFTSCSEMEQQALVEAWLKDDNYLFRSAMQSIIVLLSMGYTSHPTASKVLGQYFRCGFGQ